MKKFSIFLLVLLIITLSGYGLKQGSCNANSTAFQEKVYLSNLSDTDCYLCGGGIENLIPEYWGQNNVALISVNTFDIKPIEINRYDSGHLIEEYAGVISFGGGSSINGGFSANLMLEYDRGYATGSLDFLKDEILDIDKAASFLCSNCLNEILPKEVSRCFGVGAINLDTKEIKLFEEKLGGFGLGDFHIDCNLIERKNSDSRRMDILIFYCPIRYEETP